MGSLCIIPIHTDNVIDISILIDKVYGVLMFVLDKKIHVAKVSKKHHEKTNHGKIWYSSDQCDYKMSKKEELEKHEKSTHEQKWYSCDQCDYRKSTKEELKQH